MRRFAWGLMTALALIIAAYAIALLFVPAMRAPHPFAMTEAVWE